MRQEARVSWNRRAVLVRKVRTVAVAKHKLKQVLKVTTVAAAKHRLKQALRVMTVVVAKLKSKHRLCWC